MTTKQIIKSIKALEKVLSLGCVSAIHRDKIMNKIMTLVERLP